MNNFPFEHNGQTLWYSRSLACNLVVIAADKGGKNPKVLTCKRGQGCEFNKGLWNVPGGFIDFNENALQCALRETYEETGVKISENKVHFLSLDTNPRGFRQTMIASHYAFFIDGEITEDRFSTDHCEPDEVEEIKWISLKDLGDYDWVHGQVGNIIKAWEEIINTQHFEIDQKIASTVQSLFNL